MKNPARPKIDRELAGLSPELRWREWVRRIEAVMFSSASPIPAEQLAEVVGKKVSIELLIDDLRLELSERPYDIAHVADGWMLRTRPIYADVIQAAADIGDQQLNLSEFDLAVLAAVAYHQPITREGLRDIFGKDISRDLIGRLHAQHLIATGPRSPRRGAPYTFVTTKHFLTAFNLQSLRDLPDQEQLDDAGIGERPAPPGISS